MPKHRNLLIVVADGEHVRFIRPASDNALHSETTLDSTAAHLRSADLGTDRPGGSFHSDSTAHHALNPRRDLQAMQKEKFAHFVARQLNDGAARGSFDELVIVAPPRTLNAICEKLENATESKIIGTLAKALTKTPDDELWPHVREWVRPTHRPTA
jgi:protein required for attachment to host cells